MVKSSQLVVSPIESAVEPGLARLEQALHRVVRNSGDAVRLAVVAVLAQGHLLLEDVPGVGKTTLAQALARALDCRFQRIQFTSDLLPSDVIGVNVYSQSTERFEFHPGPLFTNLLLADEINRTTPKTQSALLEAMNERQVTVDHQSYPLPQPFWVMATQNPIEHHGTYPLPESQLDRFLLRIRMGYPAPADERAILRGEAGASMLERMEPVISQAEILQLQRGVEAVQVSDDVVDYELALVDATRHHPALELGVSPRGMLMLHRAAQAWAMLEGRNYCVPYDIKRLLLPTCAHRLVLRGHAAEHASDTALQVLQEIGAQVPVPE